MKKEIIFGIVSIAVLIIILIKNNISAENVQSEPTVYYLTDVMESDTKEQSKLFTNDTVSQLNLTGEYDTIASSLKNTKEIIHPCLSKETKDTNSNYKDKVKTKEVQQSRSPKGNAPIFKIQLLVSNQLLSSDNPLFKGLHPIKYYKIGDIYKYTYGAEYNYEKIKKIKEEQVDIKFKDAFIVAFREGNKIDLGDAIDLLKE